MQLHRVRLAQLMAVLSATSCLAAPENSGEQAKDTMKCMDTPRHKSVPSPEPGIIKSCSAYESLSCCKNETATRIHGKDLYAFDHFLCNNKIMSSECKRFFTLDACFFECSPQLAQWIQPGGDSIKNVPLCRSDCEKWFLACSNDFTCVKDWKAAHSDNFRCSEEDKCQTIKDKFQNAEKFCQKVWGNSYEVVPDDTNCFKIDVRKIDVHKIDSPKSGHDRSDSTPNAEPNSGSDIIYNIVILAGSAFLALLL